MKNSRTSLNKPFYDWIKEVREADKKIAELEDKLYYYNVKLIGYNSPNFEPRLSSTKPEYKDNRYIWIEKIRILNMEIIKLESVRNKYDKFIESLSEIHRNVMRNYFLKIRLDGRFSKSYYYKILNDIAVIKFKSEKKE